MEISNIKELKIGAPVRCKLNNSSEYGIWFTGKIVNEAILNTRRYLTLTINRDDFGYPNTWNIQVNEQNKHLLESEEFEWNEEEN